MRAVSSASVRSAVMVVLAAAWSASAGGGAAAATSREQAQTTPAPLVEQEPNNQDSQAQVIQPGTVVEATFSAAQAAAERRADDIDWYRLTGLVPGTYVLTVAPGPAECVYYFGTPSLRLARGESTMTVVVTGQGRTRMTTRMGAQPETSLETSLDINELYIAVASGAERRDNLFRCTASGEWRAAIPYRLSVRRLEAGMRGASRIAAREPTEPRMLDLRSAFERGQAARPVRPGAAQQGPRMTDITAARGVSGGQPVEPGTTFTSDINPIFVWFRHSGLAPGAVLSSVWYYLEPAAPQRIGEGSVTVQPPTDWAQFALELAPGKQWPAGAYRVELLVEGRMLGEARFTVIAGRPTAGTHYRHPRAGFEMLVPPGWQLNDQVGTADVQLRTPQGDGLIEITSGPTSDRLDPVSYAAGWESVSVGPGLRLLAKRAGHPVEVGGLPAYEGTYAGQGVVVRVVFVAAPARFYVLTAVFAADAFDARTGEFDALLRSLSVPASAIR